MKNHFNLVLAKLRLLSPIIGPSIRIVEIRYNDYKLRPPFA